MLGLSIDQQDELEDQLVIVSGIPFIANDDFLSLYGESFEVNFEEGHFIVNRV